jgi:molecular chaperone GrpE
MAHSSRVPGRPDVGDDREETKVEVRIGNSPGDPESADVDQESGAAGQAAGGGETAASAATAGEIEQLRRERDDYYDRLLRKTAEFENYRKRTERERREQSDYAALEVLRSLLPLVDSLERALAAEAAPDAEPYRRGVEIIYKQVLDLLRQYNVTPIEAVGVQFDPHAHEAVIHEVSPGHTEGEVIGELQRGYRAGERLLRPAMVKVAKA